MKSKFKNQVNQFEDVDFLKHLNLPKNTKRKQTDKVTKQCKKPKQDLTKQDKKQATKRDFVLSRMIKLIPIDSDNDQASWLTDINIDLVLEHFQTIFKSVKIITLANQISSCSTFNREKYTFESTENLIFVLNANKNHWVTVTNIDTSPKITKRYDKDNKPVFMYDSLSNSLYLNGIKPFLSEIFPLLNKYILHYAICSSII